MESARIVVEVVAGVLPGQPEAEFTKRWVVTSNEWHGPDGATRMYELTDKAKQYADSITNPNRVNWVQTTWLWL